MDTHVLDSSGEIGKLKAEIWELKYRQGYRNISPKLLLQGGGVVISMEVDHLGIEARVDKMQKTTEGIQITAHLDLGVRILIIGAIRDMGQTQTETSNQM